jgi:MFS family permease
VSDLTGRKFIYGGFFLLGAVLYAAIPLTQHYNSVATFVLITAILISMYGGGFATIPAYLRDLFGTMQIGAIHGRLITAWSMAAVLGPQLVNYVAAYRIDHGVARAEAYNVTMYVMAGLLVVGLLCNLLVGPVDAKFHHRTTDVPEPPTESA